MTKGTIKAKKSDYPDWLTTTEGDLAGNLLVGNFLLDEMGIPPTKLKYEDWGQLWDCMFQFRRKTPKLTPKEFREIAHNRYKPLKGAVPEYDKLSNVLDNLFSLYGDNDGD